MNSLKPEGCAHTAAVLETARGILYCRKNERAFERQPGRTSIVVKTFARSCRTQKKKQSTHTHSQPSDPVHKDKHVRPAPVRAPPPAAPQKIDSLGMPPAGLFLISAIYKCEWVGVNCVKYIYVVVVSLPGRL